MKNIAKIVINMMPSGHEYSVIAPDRHGEFRAS